MGHHDEQARSTGLAIDWYDPVFRQQTEFDVYERLRGVEPQRNHAGEWYVVNYDDCREAFQRADLLSNDWLAADTEQQLGRSSVFPENADGQRHRDYRRILDPLFSPARMGALEDDIRAYAVELLEPIAEQGSAELVADFTMPFPTIIFCRLMGFPVEDHPRLMRWKDIYMNSTTPFVAAQLGLDLGDDGRPSLEAVGAMVVGAADEIVDYLRALLDERRRQPADDIVSRLTVMTLPDGTPLSEDETIRICFNLFLGGLDTVTGMLSFAVAHFAEHPDDRARFVATLDDPVTAATAIEELARFHAIVAIPRRAITDCPFRGAVLAADDVLQLVTPAANRDASRFPDADSLVFDRSPNPHLGFGLGLHRCLGIHLARRELRIGLQELHRLIPDYRLDPDNPPLIGAGGVRGLFTLPLLIG